MKAKATEQWSSRSAGSLRKERGLRATLADYIRLRAETEEILTNLEREKQIDLAHVLEGDKKAEEFLSITLAKIDDRKRKLAVYGEAVDAAKAKLEEFMRQVSWHAKERRAGQEALAGLAAELPKRAREIDRMIDALHRLLAQCIELTGKMEGLGNGIDLDYYFDQHSYSQLVEALPTGILPDVEAGVARLLGKREGTKPYVVIGSQLEARENLRHSGFYQFGETAWLDAAEAGELLRKDRWKKKRTAFGNERELLPPNIMPPDEFARAQAQAEAEDCEVSQILDRQHLERIREALFPTRLEPSREAVPAPMQLSKTEIGGE